MHIVLPGGLPDADAARALLPHLQEAAPVLVSWLSNSRADLKRIDTSITGCTVFEHWCLEQAGFHPDAQQNMASGLGPLWAADELLARDESIWLAELVHLAPTQTSTAMLTAADLDVTPEESLALFESAKSLFEGTQFNLHTDSAYRWRIQFKSESNLLCASPALVATRSVNDWWPRQEAARPWRRLFNELQMLWFDHPVNRARQEQGRAPINGLWLFGGGRLEQLRSQVNPDSVQRHDALYQSFLTQDWGTWLQSMTQLDTQVFAPLAEQGEQPVLILTGNTEQATLRPRASARWTKWLPRSRNTWSNWWSYRS